MIDLMTLNLARHVLAEIRKREAEYEADVRDWYENGDGRSPQWVQTEHGQVNVGGKGYRYPRCIHGRSLWVDHDIPCGTCEMGEQRATSVAVHEAAFAVNERKRRLAWLAEMPSRDEMPEATRLALGTWASCPVTDLLVTA